MYVSLVKYFSISVFPIITKIKTQLTLHIMWIIYFESPQCMLHACYSSSDIYKFEAKNQAYSCLANDNIICKKTTFDAFSFSYDISPCSCNFANPTSNPSFGICRPTKCSTLIIESIRSKMVPKIQDKYGCPTFGNPTKHIYTLLQA